MSYYALLLAYLGPHDVDAPRSLQPGASHLMIHARPCRLTESRITIHPSLTPQGYTGFSQVDLPGMGSLAYRIGSEGICLLLPPWHSMRASRGDCPSGLRSRTQAQIQHPTDMWLREST